MTAIAISATYMKRSNDGDYPKWTMYIQVMTEEQARNMPYNPFDLTKVWYKKDFPLIEVGEIELNRNPENYFAEVEQAAFSPANIVPGIGFSPDKMLQGRLVLLWRYTALPLRRQLLANPGKLSEKCEKLPSVPPGRCDANLIRMKAGKSLTARTATASGKTAKNIKSRHSICSEMPTTGISAKMMTTTMNNRANCSA